VRQDETGFAEFYRASHQRCLRAVIAGAGRPDLAEDLVAEAFTRAWTSWHVVRRHPAPRAWVVRTAFNTRVSWWRRRRREVAIDVVPDIPEVAAGDRGPGTGLDPDLLAALRGLPERQREVIAFRVFLDLDTKATATALGIAPGTVTAHLARAVATLRGHFVSTDNLEVRS